VPAPSAESPATARQEALCLLHEVDPGAPGLVLGVAFILPDGLPPQAAGEAVARLTARHPALRTRLVRKGEHWTRSVDPTERHSAAEPWGRYCTLTRLRPGTVLSDQQLAEELTARCLHVPDLAEGPLFHTEVVLADGHPPHLVVTVHHAVADLWAVGVLLSEFMQLIGGPDGAGNPVELPAVQAVPDRLPDQNRQERAWRFWRETLGDELPVLQLPQAGRGGEHEFTGSARVTTHAPLILDERRTAAVDALAKRCGVTRYAALLAVQALTLSRLTAADRVPVAISLHGRGSASYRAVDYLVSTVAVPLDTATGTVRDLVRRAAATVREAMAHSIVGYPELVALSAVANGPDIPSPQVALLLQQDTPGAPRGLAAALLGSGRIGRGGVELGVAVPPPSIGPFGLATVLAEHGDTLVGRVEVDPRRHQDWLAGRIATTFLAVTDSLAQDDRRPLAEVSAVGEDQAKLLRDWSVSSVPEDGDGTLHELVLAAAERHPERTAVAAADGSWTYAELASRSATVAATLNAAGAGRGSTVGVLLPRGRDLPVALLGVLRSGAAYVPLDAAMPMTRLAAAVEDAGCQQVLVGAAWAAQGHLLPVRMVPMEELFVGNGLYSPEPVPVTPDDPAYLLFTSGSTGRPKGVVIPHRGAVNLVRWAGTAFGTRDLARTLAVTPTTFDLSVFELFVPLAHGCEVRLLDSALDLLDAPAHAAGATLLNTVPSAVAALLEQHALPADLRVLNMAGEPLTADLVQAVHRRIPGARVVNLYGPSETTTYSTFAEVDGADGQVPIGGPVGGTSLAVVDAELRQVPPGGTGELLIGGAGVALGYVGRPGMTAGRFLPDPERPGQRRYRTGDLVRWRPDGQLDFIGRVDHQVKVRGFRIELGDVEHALRATSPVREACVLALGQGRARRLAAYLVPSLPLGDDVVGWLRAVRRRLGQELPGYMVPAEFAVLEKLPRGRHGKLDRRMLAGMSTIPLVTGARVAPRDDMEKRVAACWAEVLSVPEVGVTDEFFDLGGHSLLLTRLAHSLGREFGVRISLAALWNRTTVAEHAAFLAESLASGQQGSPGLAPVRRLDRSRYTVAAAPDRRRT
jgi:amino acid adenylation domain-containing protein